LNLRTDRKKRKHKEERERGEWKGNDEIRTGQTDRVKTMNK